MIRKVISIVTILLVVLGVGIVVSKASPRLGEVRASDHGVNVLDNRAGDLVTTDGSFALFNVEVRNRRPDLSVEVSRVVSVRVHDVAFPVEGVVEHTVSALPVGELALVDEVAPVGEVASLHQVSTVLFPQDVLNRVGRSDTVHVHFENSRNSNDRLQHHTVRYLAGHALRLAVPFDVDFMSGRVAGVSQKTSVAGRTRVLNNVPFADLPTAAAHLSLDVRAVETARHVDGVKVAVTVQREVVDVTESVDAHETVAG